VRLTEFKVRVLIDSADEDGSWSTVGVSENILEAAWQALVDSVEYGLRRRAGEAAVQPLQRAAVAAHA